MQNNWVYRIIHADNLEYILQNGIYNRSHANHDPSYVNIGSLEIIGKRDETPVKLQGYGVIGDYVPFYFGAKSMMLFNIKTGYGVQQRDQHEIIYLCCKIDDLVALGKRYFFTDGQANTRITEHYGSLQDLDKVDWDTVNGSDFRKNGDDIDKPRRYQAEFLLHEHVPLTCVQAIVVYNESRKQHVASLLHKHGLAITVHVNPGDRFYF